MAGHRRDGRGPRGGHGGNEFLGRGPDTPSVGDPRPQITRPISLIVIAVAMAVWSLLAWIGYALVDPVLGWAAASAGLLVDAGKGLATATGTGKEVGSVLDSLNARGFGGQAIAMLRVVLKPAIIFLWVIGAFAIIAVPRILPRIGRLRGGLRH